MSKNVQRHKLPRSKENLSSKHKYTISKKCEFSSLKFSKLQVWPRLSSQMIFKRIRLVTGKCISLIWLAHNSRMECLFLIQRLTIGTTWHRTGYYVASYRYLIKNFVHKNLISSGLENDLEGVYRDLAYDKAKTIPTEKYCL